MTDCTCRKIPANERIDIMMPAGNGTLVSAAAYHKHCPEHGITIVSEKDMRAVRKSGWFDQQAAWAVSRREQAKLLAVSSDGKSAHIEWTEWEPVEDDEKVA